MHLAKVAKPTPKDNEVLIKIHASTVTASLPTDTLNLPQVAEANTPRLMDTTEVCSLYD